MFDELEKNLVNEQKRVPVNSCLKAFYGFTPEKRYRLSFVSSISPVELLSTKDIKVIQGKESDVTYWTCFDLINDDVKEVFFVFCNSLLESITGIEDQSIALSALQDRYYSWRSLFKNKGKMTFEAYQGLFGELYFLSEILGNQVGYETAVKAWVGPDGYSKDFSTKDSWFEIKTIGSASTTIKINSLAQLDSDIDGHLVSIIVERMSDSFEEGLCSVAKLYNKILDNLINHQAKEEFINKVLKYGYADEDNTINNYKFEIKKIQSYEVDKKFPKLTHETIQNSAIAQVSYELMISAIDEFMEELK